MYSRDGQEIRRRNREERVKKTKDQVEKMKENLRKHEISKKRKTYYKPLAIGLSIIVGGLLLYKLLWST